MNHTISNSNYNKTILTRSTIIKPITENEITQNYISWLNDNEINKFLETRYLEQTRIKVVNYINSLRNKNNCDMFAIINKETNIHIGNLTITSFNTNNNGSAFFGIMIGDKMSRSIGIGAEVMISFIDFLFSYDTIQRISAGAASENFKSCKTLESIGFIREGVIRKVFPLNNGEKCDLIHYGLLREEWNDKRKKFTTFLNMTEILSN
jgi:[ribosomal protein S5]-alanine N-acetyltransferase